MKFGSLPIAEARSAILAHAVKGQRIALKKGEAINAHSIRENGCDLMPRRLLARPRSRRPAAG